MARKMIDRKEFLKSALVLAGAGVGVASLAACGSDGGKGGSGGNSGGTGDSSGGNACDAHEPMEDIATNHPAGSQHTLAVTAAEVAAGADKTYSIKGLSAHDHSITITAAMFAKLESGMSIMTTSTSSVGHTHVVSVVCA